MGSGTLGSLRLGSGTLGSMRLGSTPISPSGRSFHHFLPELAESAAVPSSSRRCELARWDLDCAVMTKEQLVRHKAGGIVLTQGGHVQCGLSCGCV